ncbi:phage recombination protein Bet [Comamonas kerstersii]|uniref:Phage recombination protein Bet n=1 Tax=Comamonas kerstersii TaxID=225992 RepID=A0A1V0BHE1_9BURK|nr:phage recombination protein Bet [Comamonas kerstersii]
MSNALVSLTQKLAATLNMGDGAGLIETLKATAFKGQVSDAQMTALMVVANQYALNPWTKEIYAFPDKNNGIVPVVGVDGWSRIINSHPQFDGIEFEQDEQSCTCIIFRKDRNRPIKVTEWMAECKRGTGPWQSHPKRMLRHKAMIQCARLAFGYGGIYDQDEAERIVEGQPQQRHPVDMGPAEVVEQPEWPADRWAAGLPKWVKGIADGKPLDEVLAWLKSKGRVTAEQEKQLRAEVAKLQQPAPQTQDAPQVDPNKLAADMQACNDLDKLYELAGLMEAITDEAAKLRIEEIFAAKQAELEQAP